MDDLVNVSVLNFDGSQSSWVNLNSKIIRPYQFYKLK